MIPYRPSIDRVWVIVILEVTKSQDIIRPSVPRRSTVGAMQMQVHFAISLVDNSNNCFSAFLHSESRAWKSTIEAGEFCFLQVRIELFLKILDFKLIEVNWYAAFWISVCCQRSLQFRDGQCLLKRIFVCWTSACAWS